MEKSKQIKNVEFQIASKSVEDNSVHLEFIDECDHEFFRIYIDQNNIRHVLLFQLESDVTFPLAELEKGIEISKRKVINVEIPDE